MNRRQNDTPNMPASPDSPTSHRSRRLFGKRLLVGLPAAVAAAVFASQAEVAEAGTDGDWSLTGNTLPDATKFIGSKNAQPLTFKTNNSTRMTLTNSGSVGIGTTLPSAKLHAVTSISAIIGESTATSGSIIGVMGQSSSTDGTGVRGEALAASGGTTGVFGISVSPDGRGVFGYNGAAAGIAYGVAGSSDQGVGVNGDGNVGVRGFGVSAGILGSSASVAIWGMSQNGLAGEFDGNVLVTGTLIKSAGSFKIDHPLDPANKYLSHSFVESPDMLNVYNGVVMLDASGAAVVELPGYFEALNQEFRYQLTAVGAPSPNLHIAQEIQNNRFSIAGGAPGMTVSWQVTGVRHDPYAEAHRIVVEQDKPADERGAYLAPQEHGQPETKKLFYDRIQQVQARSAAVELIPPAAPPADEAPPDR